MWQGREGLAMDLFGIGGGEILVILLVALLVLGPQKIVGVGKTLGKITRYLKNASTDFSAQLNKELELEDSKAQSQTEKKDR